MKLMAALLSATLLASCSKEPVLNEKTISASLPSDTKVSMMPSETGLSLAWQTGDKLGVCAGGTTKLYSIMDGFTAHEAQFSGEPLSGDRFTVYYPGQKYDGPEAIKARKYNVQHQKGNGSTAHLEWNAMLEECADYLHLNFAEARQNSVLMISLMLPEDVPSVEAVSISAGSDVFYLTNDAEGPMTNGMRLELEDVDLSSHSLTVYMMLPWYDVALSAGTKLQVTVEAGGGGKYTKKLSVPAGGIVIRSGKLNIIRLYQDVSGDFASPLEGFVWSDNNFWE